MSASAAHRHNDGTTTPLPVLTLSDNQWAVFCELLPNEHIDLDLGRPFLPGRMETDASGLDGPGRDVVIVYTLRGPAQ